MAFEWYNQNSKTRFLKVNQVGFVPYLDTSMECPSCSDEVVKGFGSWLGKCKTCGALVSFFKGTPIQEVACSIDSPTIFNIGSVGSGKTTISAYIISNHMRRHQGANVLATAITLEQLKKYAIPEFAKFIHPSEIRKKTDTNWELTNGSKISFVASDNEDKIRSANATSIWIVEGAPNKMFSIFRQGQARLRNSNAIEYEKNEDGKVIMMRYPNGKVTPKIKSVNTLMLVEANPKKGSWLKAQILKSHTIFHTTSVKGIPLLKASALPQRIISEFSGEEMNVQQVSILNATVDNPILTESFFIALRATMASQEEYDREVYCDLTSEEGIVFKDIIPKLNDIFIPIHSTYSPDPNIMWVESLDPGGSNDNNDPACYLLMQINKQTKQLRIVDGFYTSGMSLSEECAKIQQVREKHHYSSSRSFLFTADNVLERSLKINKYQSLRTEYEVRLSSSITVCNNKGIKYGVGILLDWFRADAITISDQLEFVKAELLAYEYIVKKEVIKDAVVETQKFSAGYDHSIDVLRYAVVMLESYGIKQDQHRIDSQKLMKQEADVLTIRTKNGMYDQTTNNFILDMIMPNLTNDIRVKNISQKKYKV